jgi:hypothetical protein
MRARYVQLPKNATSIFLLQYIYLQYILIYFYIRKLSNEFKYSTHNVCSDCSIWSGNSYGSKPIVNEAHAIAVPRELPECSFTPGACKTGHPGGPT